MLYEHAYVWDKGSGSAGGPGGILLESVMTMKGPVLLAAIISSEKQGQRLLSWFYGEALPILLEEEFHHRLKSTFLRKMGEEKEHTEMILLYGKRYFSASVNHEKRKSSAEINLERRENTLDGDFGRVYLLRSGKEGTKGNRLGLNCSLRFGKLKKKDSVLLCTGSFIEKMGEEPVYRKMGQIGFGRKNSCQTNLAEAAESKMQEIKRRLRSRGEKNRIAAIFIWIKKK